MATTLALVPGFGISAGETTTADEFRWAALSGFDVGAGSAGNLSRGGIMPAGQANAAGRLGGLRVSPQGSPAMSVLVAAGKIAIPSNSSADAPFGAALLVDGTIDGFGAAHATVARTDLIIAEVQVTGTSSSLAQLRILPGTNGVTTRPTLPTTPGVTHAVAIATVTIQPLSTRPTSNIQASDITIAASDTWSKADSDVGYMAAPGATVITPPGILAMTAVRRNAWAALHADGTRWLDVTTGCEGYIRAGGVVPTTPRVLLNAFGDTALSNSGGTATQLAGHGALTFIGGSRLVEVYASCVMYGTAHAGARASVDAMQGPYLTMEVEGANGDNLHTASRSWRFAQAAGTVAADAWRMTGFRDGGSGTVSFVQRTLVVIDWGPYVS